MNTFFFTFFPFSHLTYAYFFFLLTSSASFSFFLSSHSFSLFSNSSFWLQEQHLSLLSSSIPFYLPLSPLPFFVFPLFLSILPIPCIIHPLPPLSSLSCPASTQPSYLLPPPFFPTSSQPSYLFISPHPIPHLLLLSITRQLLLCIHSFPLSLLL